MRTCEDVHSTTVVIHRPRHGEVFSIGIGSAMRLIRPLLEAARAVFLRSWPAPGQHEGRHRILATLGVAVRWRAILMMPEG
jgi:hypothetical protein